MVGFRKGLTLEKSVKMKDEHMRVDPEFKKLVEDIADEIARDLGIKNKKGSRNRKISTRLVTKKLSEQIKKRSRFEL